MRYLILFVARGLFDMQYGRIFVFSIGKGDFGDILIGSVEFLLMFIFFGRPDLE